MWRNLQNLRSTSLSVTLGAGGGKSPKTSPQFEFQVSTGTFHRTKRFHVESLPNDLKKLPLSCPYVWLDLLCIPQDNRKEAQEEIARQAAIFIGVASSIVWFNEIESRESTENIIQWFAYQYLQLANLKKCHLEETAVKERVEKAARASNGRIDFWLVYISLDASRGLPST